MSEQNLTQERLVGLFDYDQETGVFVRKSSSGGRFAGSVVGAKNKKGYLVTTIDGKSYYLHRLAFMFVNGSWPLGQIDHINGVRADNRIANLRDVSHQDNLRNRRNAQRTNISSGLLGSTFHKHSGKWQAQIRFNGKSKSLGYFDTAIEAHNAYLSAKRELHSTCTI